MLLWTRFRKDFRNSGKIGLFSLRFSVSMSTLLSLFMKSFTIISPFSLVGLLACAVLVSCEEKENASTPVVMQEKASSLSVASEQKEAAQKAYEEAAAKAAYNAKCAKYGKVYVDAAAERKLMVGMHLDLVKEIYGENYLRRGRVYSDGTSYYYVESMAGTILVSVWFRNDKVTDFSHR